MPRMDVEIFVRVERHQPIGLPNEIVFVGGAKCGVLGHPTGRLIRIVASGHTCAGKQIEQTIRPVVAIVCVDKEFRDANRPVMSDSVRDERPLVLHGGHHGDLPALGRSAPNGRLNLELVGKCRGQGTRQNGVLRQL